MAVDLYRSFETLIKEHQMIHKDERIVIGVSGGADSVCLLLLLRRYSEKVPCRITAVHLNHMIRKETAMRDAQYVETLCRSLQIPCIAESANVPEEAAKTGESLEEAGRRLRYELLCKIAREQNGTIAVAHHKNDNAETVLLNLLRGTGLKGLSGMQPVSEWNGCKIIRPLLSFYRSEIEEWLLAEGISYCEDETNLDPSYARNAVRLNIIPEMEKINGRALEHFCRSATEFGKIERFLQQETERNLERIARIREEEAELSVPELETTDPLIAGRVAYQAVARMAKSRKDLEAVHVQEILELAGRQSGKKVSLPYGLEAVREYDRIRIRKAELSSAEQEPLMLQIAKETLGPEEQIFTLSDGSRISLKTVSVDEANRAALMEKNQYTKAFDYDTIIDTVKVGRKVPADRIFLQNGTKTMKKYFADEKIPAGQREKILLLKDEESVLWIIGRRISERHKITDSTKTALIAAVIGGDHEF